MPWLIYNYLSYHKGTFRFFIISLFKSIPRNLAGVIVFNQRIPLEGSNLGVEDSLHRRWKSSEQLVGAEIK